MTDYAAFREEVRAFLAENLTPELRLATARATSVFVEPEFSLAWQRILHQKGWVAPHWPAEYGGPGWDERQRHIFASECAIAGAPSLSPMGLRMVAPVIMHYGTAAQKAFYLPRLLSGEDYWCQGFSEPGAGSDLASLQLRAEVDGEDYVLTGSKIWTTHAHHANRMFALVRTSRDERPQQGITFLLLDMNLPGITVRPIYSIADDHDFNEVFFDGVRVPQSGRLGEEGMGWSVAKHLLVFERAAAYAAGLGEALAQAARDAAIADVIDDRAIRRRISQLAVEVEAIRAVERGIMAMLARGDNPGALSSLLKLRGTETQQAIQELAVEVAGPYAAPSQPEARRAGSNVEAIGPEHALTPSARYFNGRAASIYAGSNEIQRGIIAKQVLGL